MTQFISGEQASATSVAPASIPIAPTDEALLTRKIMIIDDEPINCKLVRKYLSMAGYACKAPL